jgi:hypothetical protein
MRNPLRHSDRLARPRAIALLLSVVIVIALPSSGEDVTPTAGAAIENLDRPEVAAARHQGGMRIYLDEDGRPTLPPVDPPGVSRARQTSRPMAAEPEPLPEIEGPGGGTMVILDGRFQSHSTARITEDGTLSVECKRPTPGLHTGARGLHAHVGAHADAPDHNGLEGKRSSGSAGLIGPGASCAPGASGSPASSTSEDLR